jgi:hypothetical protein
MLIAYVAVLQPVLISSTRGLAALTIPASVCLMFALSAGLLMAVSRVGVAALRTRTTAARRT